MNWDDNSLRTATVEFDYDAVDRALDGPRCSRLHAAIADSTPIELTCEAQRRIWSWVWQPPVADLDGFTCRCAVAAWVFVPQLSSYSMTEMAGRLGKKKQSLGRWVVSFKRQFPEIAKHLPHVRHEI